jgi:hypothetical protein
MMMSVDCTGYIGYTVTLKRDLNSDDFDFFNDFEDEHGEYSQWDFKSKTKERVRLVIDGMSGDFARLIFVDDTIEDCWMDGKDYFALRSSDVPDDVYNELNKAYKLMYNKDLDKTLIEYALWFLFS